MAKPYSIVWLDHMLFICLSVDEHLCYFYIVAIMNNAVRKTHVTHFVWKCVFSSLPRNLGVELLVHMVTLFTFLRTYQTVFDGTCSISPFHQQYVEFSVLYILVNIVVLSYMSLIMKEVEHLFMSLFTISRSSLEKCLFQSFTHFF